jgi:hypothetical protein
MGKRLWAIWTKQFAISLLVLFIFGVAFNYFAYNPESRSPFLAGFLAMVVYLVVVAGMGLLNLISGALYLWVFADKDLSAAILDDFRAVRLPAPRNSDSKTYDYLASLADDESAAASDRVKAAVLHGSYQTALGQGFFRALIFRRAIDNAVLRYYQEAPQRG